MKLANKIQVAALLLCGATQSHGTIISNGDNFINDASDPDRIRVGSNFSAPAAGTLTVDGGDALSARDIIIGDSPNSVGAVTLNNGTLTTTAAAGVGTSFRIGQGGAGTLNASNGSQINMGGEPFFVIGRLPGSSGSATLDASSITLTVQGTAGGAFGGAAHIGREGTGTLTLNNGSSLTMSDPAGTPGTADTRGESITVGRGGATGTLVVDASTVDVSGTGAFLFVGRENSNASATFRNGSTLNLTSTSGDAGDSVGISVGRQGTTNTGTLTVDNSIVNLNGGASHSNIFIGREGADGVANFTGSGTTVTLNGTGQSGVVVGREPNTIATATVSDGATININGDVGRLDVARVGSVGTLTIANGGKVNAIGTGDRATGDGDVFIGAAFANFGRPEAGTGTVVVDGVGSELNALDRIVVGAPEAFGGGVGSGTLTVRNGATATANEINVGTGGLLNGDGTIVGTVVIDGGVVAAGNSPGTLVIDGDLILTSGRLELEEGDFLDVSGLIEFGADLIIDIIVESALTEIDFGQFFPDNDPTFAAGTTFETAQINLLTNNRTSVGTPLTLNLGNNSRELTFADASPAPEAHTLALMSAGLLLVGLVRRRRR